MGTQNYNDYFIKNPHKISRFAGNLCWGRSGSYLMCSLFDGHPEILTLPPHSYASWVIRISNFLPLFKQSSTKEIVDSLYDFFPTATIEGNFKERWSLVNADGSFLARIGDEKQLKLGVPEKEYLKNLMVIIENMKKYNIIPNVRTLLNAIHIAYVVAGGHKITTKSPLVFFSLHGRIESVIDLINAEYDEFHLIINSRNPSKTYDSHLFHHFFENKAERFTSLSYHLINHYIKDGQKVFSENGNSINTISVRFEDIHEFTEATMRNLAKMLKIKWHPILLDSTINSKIMWIERNGELCTGTNHRAANENKYKLLSEFDVYLIQSILDNYYNKWNYKKKNVGFVKEKYFYPCLCYVSLRFFPFLIPSVRKGIKLDLQKKPLTFSRLHDILKDYFRCKQNFNILLRDMRALGVEKIPGVLDIVH